MKFLPLFVVHLTHPYYADGRCPDFLIEPTRPTQKLLRNHRCVLKPRPGGVQVLTTVTDQGVPFIPMRQDAALTFHLRLQNPDFARFTDLTEMRTTTAPVFTNVNPSPEDPLLLSLVSRPIPSASAPRPTEKRFAKVEIRHHGALAPSPNGPRAFHVAFKAKQARWIYYYVSDLSPSGGGFQIVDADASPLVFSRENRRDLKQDPDPSDAIAQTLAAQYPDLRQFRFMSDGLVPCQQAARKQLSLLLDGNRVAGALPNPSLRHAATMAIDINGETQQQDVLFHIVKHITQPFPTTGG